MTKKTAFCLNMLIMIMTKTLNIFKNFEILDQFNFSD